MKKMKLAFYVLCMGVILTGSAAAYVDASVTTMVLQAVVGVVVVAGAVFGVVWRKAKKKAQEVLNIDENANKVVEDDIVVDESTAAELSAEQSAPADAE